MSIRTVVVDDEPLARDWVREQLREDGEIDIVAECEDGFKAVEAIGSTKPDLLILDIQMPGLDGFGVLRMLENQPPPAVIFLTAFDRYALQAFEVNAVDYLLKPVSPERLHSALVRIKAHVRERQSGDLATRLMTALDGKGRHADWLLIKNDGKSHFLRVTDIDWIESQRNNVALHVGASTHVYHDTTAGIEARLDPARFLRIHRSTIVNIDRIKELHPWFNGDYAVTLKDGTRLTLSNSYKYKLKAFRRGTN
jgi:two-component system, LytTR family, response regulator